MKITEKMKAAMVQFGEIIRAAPEGTAILLGYSTSDETTGVFEGNVCSIQAKHGNALIWITTLLSDQIADLEMKIKDEQDQKVVKIVEATITRHKEALRLLIGDYLHSTVKETPLPTHMEPMGRQ